MHYLWFRRNEMIYLSGSEYPVAVMFMGDFVYEMFGDHVYHHSYYLCQDVPLVEVTCLNNVLFVVVPSVMNRYWIDQLLHLLVRKSLDNRILVVFR